MHKSNLPRFLVFLFVSSESLLCQFLVFGAWLAIVGIRPDADAATRSKDACYLYIFRVHQFDEILHDDVYAVFMEVAMVAETEEIKFQTLALYHLYVRNIADANLCEIWLTRNRAERCKLRAVETYPVIIARMLVHESFEHLWRIIHSICSLGT